MPATRVACSPLRQVDLLAVEELQIREEKMGWQRSGVFDDAGEERGVLGVWVRIRR